MSSLNMDLASGIAAFEAKEFPRAMQLLQPLAEKGDAQAQYRVAIMAQVGLGMVKNCDLALAHGTGGSLGTRHASATVIMERE